jgi:hypothetical protein
MGWYDAFRRRQYRGGHPSALARFQNRTSALVFGAGIGPRHAAKLEVVGRSRGRRISFPVVIADWDRLGG